MSGPKCPCRQDCRERSGRCHAACPKYLAYEQEKMRSYREKQRCRERMELSDGARRNIAAFDRAYQEGRRTYGK